MSDEKPEIPFHSAVLPEVLTERSQIRFRCYPGISCFNACCRRADATLAPYDILRLKQRLGLTSTEFLAKYTVPFQMDADGTPGVKLKTTDEGACLLLDGDQGCGVYPDRPTVCRYYPLALLNRRVAGESDSLQEYSLVSEDHCKGHLEDRPINIDAYRRLRDKVDIPLLSGETSDGAHFNIADFIAFDGAEMVRTSTHYKGGVTGAMRVAHLAQAFNMRAEVHGGDADAPGRPASR